MDATTLATVIIYAYRFGGGLDQAISEAGKAIEIIKMQERMEAAF